MFDVDGLMDNFEKISHHLLQKKNEKVLDKDYIPLSTLSSIEGKNYFLFDGNVWRILDYIEDTDVFEFIQSSQQANDV